jgi:sulfate adenylyltransferase
MTHDTTATHEQHQSTTATPAGPGGRFEPRERVMTPEERDEFRWRAMSMRRLTLSPVALCDLNLLGVGAMTPLAGFMGHVDYRSVLENMVLADGTTFGLPITLPVPDGDAGSFQEGQEVALCDASGTVRGGLVVDEVFTRNRALEAMQTFGTASEEHPAVRLLSDSSDTCLAGKIQLVERPEDPRFGTLLRTPLEVRAEFRRRGWSTVVGFQTRNPIHRAHEYLTKCALEVVDGLMLHPLVGETKAEDIPADVRMDCYRALLERYYPADRTLLSVFPAAMRYAGPREAIFHTRLRSNYGCTHFIVGRDHAGVGKFYGPYDAQNLLRQFTTDQLGLEPLFFDNTFYCQTCEGFASIKTCPHGPDQQLSLSGTRVREMLARAEPLPAHFSRPEVAEILTRHYQSLT